MRTSFKLKQKCNIHSLTILSTNLFIDPLEEDISPVATSNSLQRVKSSSDYLIMSGAVSQTDSSLIGQPHLRVESKLTS